MSWLRVDEFLEAPRSRREGNHCDWYSPCWSAVGPVVPRKAACGPITVSAQAELHSRARLPATAHAARLTTGRLCLSGHPICRWISIHSRNQSANRCARARSYRAHQITKRQKDIPPQTEHEQDTRGEPRDSLDAKDGVQVGIREVILGSPRRSRRRLRHCDMVPACPA
jgi:hypothetical protein